MINNDHLPLLRIMCDKLRSDMMTLFKLHCLYTALSHLSWFSMISLSFSMFFDDFYIIFDSLWRQINEITQKSRNFILTGAFCMKSRRSARLSMSRRRKPAPNTKNKVKSLNCQQSKFLVGRIVRLTQQFKKHFVYIVYSVYIAYIACYTMYTMYKLYTLYTLKILENHWHIIKFTSDNELWK